MFSRGIEFARRQGWRKFALRALSVWLWGPRVLSDLLAGGRAAGRGRVTDTGEGEIDLTLPYGVNVIGYLNAEKGLGQAARYFALALGVAGVPYEPWDVPVPGSRASGSKSSLKGSSRFRFNLFCVNGGELPEILAHRDGPEIGGRYNIALWHWELSEFPEYWRRSFAYLDEVWVPTRFIAEAFAAQSPVPVRKVPLPVLPPSPARRTYTRQELGVPKAKFTFLFAFDFHSVVARKNPMGLIEAFRLAFSAGEPVALVIKTINAKLCPREWGRLKSAAKGLNVSLIDRAIDREAMNALYDCCDCYVSLHRGEGFGLTLAEAMLARKPVIATGYSGNLDFMNAENSYLVDYRLAEVGPGNEPYAPSSLWAEPNIGHAAELMRWVYEHREEAAAKAVRGAETIEKNYAPEVVAQQIKERLSAIAGRS